MAQFSDNIDRLPFNALNGGSGDPVIGQPNASVSGIPVIGYDGQLGKRYVVTGVNVGVATNEATRLSNTTVGTLYGGVYQYVQVPSTATATPVIGNIAFWTDPTKMTVNADAAANSVQMGVFINAITKGDYGWVQIGGLASVLFKTSITKATPAIGDLVIYDQTPSAKGDILADATNLTSVLARSFIGRAWNTAPVGGAVSEVIIWPFLANAGF